MRSDTYTPHLSVRIPAALAADLRRAADKESNTASAVARRLIATGLSKELRSADACDEERRG